LNSDYSLKIVLITADISYINTESSSIKLTIVVFATKHHKYNTVYTYLKLITKWHHDLTSDLLRIFDYGFDTAFYGASGSLGNGMASAGTSRDGVPSGNLPV